MLTIKTGFTTYPDLPRLFPFHDKSKFYYTNYEVCTQKLGVKEGAAVSHCLLNLIVMVQYTRNPTDNDCGNGRHIVHLQMEGDQS